MYKHYILYEDVVLLVYNTLTNRTERFMERHATHGREWRVDHVTGPGVGKQLDSVLVVPGHSLEPVPRIDGIHVVVVSAVHVQNVSSALPSLETDNISFTRHERI